jgi:hypothetical protein
MSNKFSLPVLSLGLAASLALTGCKKPNSPTPAAVASSPEAPAAAVSSTGPSAVVTPPPAGASAVATAEAFFDIRTIPISDQALPAWPYVALPAGYVFLHADNLASRSKDLARVPVWTGSQLLWLEGRVFSDDIHPAREKTYSRFEVRKKIREALEAQGAVRLTERSFDEAVEKAFKKDLHDFRDEFSSIRDAYYADRDAETYVIRRAGSAIWMVFYSDNGSGELMVAEGPLPPTPSKP